MSGQEAGNRAAGQPGKVAQPLPHGDLDQLLALLASHPFTEGLELPHLAILAHNAGTVHVDAQHYVFRQGATADALYLLLEGDIDLEVAGGGGPPLILESLHGGDALGWSWLTPAQPWLFDAHARTATTAIVVDGTALRAAIDSDATFGLEVVRRVTEMVSDRLRHARLHIVGGWTHDRDR